MITFLVRDDEIAGLDAPMEDDEPLVRLLKGLWELYRAWLALVGLYK